MQGIIGFCIAILVLCGVASWLDAQETERILNCLDDVPDEWRWLRDVEGVTIWIGYDEGGWDVPADLYPYPVRVLSAESPTDNHMMEIWIGYAPSTPGVTYWWIFDDVSVFADSAGAHEGIHPCGAYAVGGLN